MCSLPGDCARGTCGRGVGLGGRSPPSQGSPRGRSYNSSAQRSHPTAVASLLTLAHRSGRAGGEPRHHGQQPARVHKDLPAAARWSSGALPDRTGADTPRNWSSGALPGGATPLCALVKWGRSLVQPHAAARCSSEALPRRTGAARPRYWSSGALPGGATPLCTLVKWGAPWYCHAAARWSSGAHPRRAGLNTQASA